jgi:AraC-like DNA-binding protein
MNASRLIVRSLAQDFAAGHETHRHDHAWGQIVFAEAGLIRLTAARDEYIIPPVMAGYVPPRLDHSLRMLTPARVRTLYLHADIAPDQDKALIAAAGPFLRELIRAIVALAPLREDDPEQRAYALVLVRELRAARPLPLGLRVPADPRAARAAQIAATSEDDLPAIARKAGASARTLQRLFLEETGLRFAHWRQQRRLLDAARALAEGASVGEAAAAARYQSESAFVAAFRRQFGATPRRWAETRGAG